MASNDRVEVQVAIQNAQKVFVSRTAATTTSTSVDLSATNDTDGLPIAPTAAQLAAGLNFPSPMLVIQPDADIYYSLTPAAGTAAAATSIRVLANQQEYVCPKNGRKFLNIVAVATANVNVFVVRT